MSNEVPGISSRSAPLRPTPPSGGTIKTSVEWLELQNKAWAKERRGDIRGRAEEEIYLLLGGRPALQPPNTALPGKLNFAQKQAGWQQLLKKHASDLARIAGSPYKMIRAKPGDDQLTSRVVLLELALRSLLSEYAHWLGVAELPVPPNASFSIDMQFEGLRSLRNAVLQRTHAISKVNNFVLKSGDKALLERKMTTYYKSISEFIDATVNNFLDANKGSTILLSNARRYVREWEPFARKHLIDSLKLRRANEDELLLKTSQGKYERDIMARLVASESSVAISGVEVASKASPRQKADLVLNNGVEVNFKALGAKGFVALATLPTKLKSKPFRVMAEIQRLAENEKRIPELHLALIGNPFSGIEISIDAHSNADVYERFMEFVVNSLSTIK